MAKGTGTYDDPIICDGLFSKTIDGVKKFFKLKTGASVDDSNYAKLNQDNVFTCKHNDIQKKILLDTDDSEITNGLSIIKDQPTDNEDYFSQIYLFCNRGSMGLQFKKAKTKNNLLNANFSFNESAISFSNKNRYLFHRNVIPEYTDSADQLCIRFPFKIQIICFEHTIGNPTQQRYSFNFLKPFKGKPYTIKALATSDFNKSQILNTTTPRTNMSSMDLILSSDIINSGVSVRFQIMIIGAYE